MPDQTSELLKPAIRRQKTIKLRESFKTLEKFDREKVNLKYQMCRAGTGRAGAKLSNLFVNFLASPTLFDIGT